MTLLPLSFYQRNDVVRIAKELLGKVLTTKIKGYLTSGIISEVEAYGGVLDRACHAYLGKKTNRNQALFEEGGICYVYQCYGIHFLLNAVTNLKEVPEAVLIRSIFPLEGIEAMRLRRNKKSEKSLAEGPGNLCQALGITKNQNFLSLQSSTLFISDEGIKIDLKKIETSCRIGISYAGIDAKRPWRFTIPRQIMNTLLS